MERAASEQVHRAVHTPSSAIEQVGLDHRGPHVFVAEQLLDRAHTIPIREEVGGEGVPKRVARGAPGQASLANRGPEGFLYDGFVDVMAPLLARALGDAVRHRMSPS